MISSLFGDENIQNLRLPSVTEINDGLCVKPAKTIQCKVCCINMSAEE